jgi:Zn-dependent protease
VIGPGLTVGTVFGIPIRVDFSWGLVAVLMTTSFAFGFGQSYPYLGLAARLSLGLSSCLLLFGSVVAHELSHAVVALRNKVGIRGITLFIFGGAAEMIEEPKSAGAEFRIAIAGPLMSLFLAALFYAFHSVTLGAIPLPFLDVMEFVAVMNLLLVAFNVVPGFPLDGGRVLRAALWGIWGSFSAATRVAASVGSLFGAVVVLIGLTTIFFLDNVIGGLWYVFIGFFLRYVARGSYQQLVIRQALSGVRAQDLMIRDVPCVPPDMRLSTVLDEVVAPHDVSEVPVVDRGLLVGVLRLESFGRRGRDELERLTVSDVMTNDVLADVLDPDDEATKVLALLAAGNQRLMVVADGVLLGVLSRDDVMRRLRLHLEMGARL